MFLLHDYAPVPQCNIVSDTPVVIDEAGNALGPGKWVQVDKDLARIPKIPTGSI
jgi:hypothetical protein